MAGLDVAGCCRLCLKDASSSIASRIDLLKEQAVANLINELYKVNVKPFDRGSKYICVPCYRNATHHKKHLDSYKTKTLLVSTNQTILESQADELLEDSDDDTVYCESRTGYRPPISSPVDMLLHLKDCMRSKRFRDALHDQYELGYVLLSGPIYQKSSGTVQDVWHPVQLFCIKCRRKFEDQISFDDHVISCKFKCIFCSRHYAHEETLRLHSCPKRDKYRKSKKRKHKPTTFNPPVVADGRKTVPETGTAEQSSENIAVLPVPDSLPAPSVPPRIEGEASLDVELTNLLERWYGQGEEIEEISHLSVGAIDAPQDNGVFTNSELYSRIIENSLKNNSIEAKPAISVKPMSQLVETPVEQMLPSTVPEMASTYNSPVDVIEIDDDDDLTPSASVSAADKPEQSLSEKDILSIVKHFRGIDENESYLVKAKINGTQKLICISKRKNDDDEQSSVASMVPNSSNSALQSGSRNPQKQIVISPTIKQPTIIQKPNIVAQPAVSKPTLIVKNVSDINGGLIPQMPTNSRGPQLKISHVQSLVSEPGTTHAPDMNNPQRILNGLPHHNVVIGTSTMDARRLQSASFSVRSAASKNPPGLAIKPVPQRIIVGSNSLKFSGGSSRYMPIAPKTLIPSSSRATPQQRIIVQRKQVQTIIKSSTATRTNIESSIHSTTSSSSTTDFNNSLLRSQLQQQPSMIYPSASGPAQNGNRSAGFKALDGLTNATKQFMVNNTTIKRLNK